MDRETRRDGGGRPLRRWKPLLLVVLGCGLVVAADAPARGQLPGMPGAPAPASPPHGGAAEPTKDKSGGRVATAAGPIKVDNPVDDGAIETTLETLLPKYPGVRSLDATVDKGVVTLEGQVDDDDTRDQMTKVAEKVEGVRLVINRLKTDEEVLTAPALVIRKVRAIWEIVSRHWLLGLLALAVLLGFSALARLFNGYADTLLAPFIKNVMLRSVAGSLIGGLLILGGVMFGLSILNLTHAVLSVLGIAGVVGLAVGFAFKDITENFIASVLLGVRRPFQVGDFVTVAGQTGVVRSLNTRATVLVTLEGNHVRIPNNIIYKEILVNATASPSARGNFDVLIPYEASTAVAIEAMTGALREGDDILREPPPRALIEALEPGGVRLRAYYWAPVHEVDWFKLHSDAKLRVKVALQRAGIIAPAAAPPAGSNGNGNGDARSPQPAVSHEQCEANLRRDTRAAESATAAPAAGASTPMGHVLNEAESRVSEEGTNLLAESK